MNDLKLEKIREKEIKEKSNLLNYNRQMHFNFQGYNIEIQKNIQTTRRLKRTPSRFFHSDSSSVYGSSSQEHFNGYAIDDSIKKIDHLSNQQIDSNR